MTVRNLSYTKVNSVNSLYLISDKINGYIKEGNENKYLTLAPIDESKVTKKKYEELWSKIRALIRAITNNSDVYDQKYMKIKVNLDNG